MPENTPDAPVAPDTKPAAPGGEKPAAENAAAEKPVTPPQTPEQRAEEARAAVQKELNTAYLEAAKKGNLKALQELLARGADLNAADDGNTALFFAAQYGRRDAALFLLDQGAPYNAKNRIGSTPLTAAAGGGHKDVAQLLYDLGGDPAEKNLTGMSALDYARSAGYTDVIEILRAPRGNPVEVTFSRQMGDRTLQEVFNFTRQDRVTLVRKGETGPVEAMQRDNFADIKDEWDLKRAFETYKKRGGTITESAIFADRRKAAAEEKQQKPKKKNWLSKLW
jgi:hypothetical protein